MKNELCNCSDFDTFFEIFSQAIDSNCKLDKPKLSKRNPINNPWITDGIIEAILTKEQLYDDWNSAKKSKELSPEQIGACLTKFTNYRRCLKRVIKIQKNSYNCTKIMEHQGDRKKTSQVI